MTPPHNVMVHNIIAEYERSTADQRSAGTLWYDEAGRIVRRIREFLTRRAPQREACDLGAVARRAAALLRRTALSSSPTRLLSLALAEARRLATGSRPTMN